MCQAEEQRLVVQLVVHAAVASEGRPLDVAVLLGPFRPDVVPLRADLSALCQHRIAREFGVIVAEDHSRLTALRDQLPQFAHHTAA